MEITTPNQISRAQKTRKFRIDSGFQKCRRGPRDRLTGGEKVETREHLEILLSQRDHKLMRKNGSGLWITDLATNNCQIELMKDRISGEKRLRIRSSEFPSTIGLI
jgi:hypothetical protein